MLLKYQLVYAEAVRQEFLSVSYYDEERILMTAFVRFRRKKCGFDAGLFPGAVPSTLAIVTVTV